MEISTKRLPDMDQSGPLKPGFIRVPNFMDVRVYNDLAFKVYYEQSGWGRMILDRNHQRAWGNEEEEKRLCELEFNTVYLADFGAARAWNRFAEKWLNARKWKIQMCGASGWGDQKADHGDGRGYKAELFGSEREALSEIDSYFAPPGGIEGSKSDFRAVPAYIRSGENFYS
jgi:hypothetical protein